MQYQQHNVYTYSLVQSYTSESTGEQLSSHCGVDWCTGLKVLEVEECKEIKNFTLTLLPCIIVASCFRQSSKYRATALSSLKPSSCLTCRHSIKVSSKTCKTHLRTFKDARLKAHKHTVKTCGKPFDDTDIYALLHNDLRKRLFHVTQNIIWLQNIAQPL